MFEILAADVQISRQYTCCFKLAHESRGLGLRFPRFLRDRPDKKAESATSPKFIFDMYNNQAAVKNKLKVNFDDDEEY